MEGSLTQAAVYGLDKELSYPVERNAPRSTPAQTNFAHDVVMRDTVPPNRTEL